MTTCSFSIFRFCFMFELLLLLLIRLLLFLVLYFLLLIYCCYCCHCSCCCSCFSFCSCCCFVVVMWLFCCSSPNPGEPKNFKNAIFRQFQSFPLSLPKPLSSKSVFFLSSSSSDSWTLLSPFLLSSFSLSSISINVQTLLLFSFLNLSFLLCFCLYLLVFASFLHIPFVKSSLLQTTLRSCFGSLLIFSCVASFL